MMAGWFSRKKNDDKGPRFVTINEAGETVEVDVNQAIYGTSPANHQQRPVAARPETRPSRSTAPQSATTPPPPDPTRPQTPTNAAQGMYTPRSRGRSGYDFAPMPPPPKRSWLRWIVLAFNAIPFAILVFAYPVLEENAPQIFATNITWLVIPAWGLLVIAHLLIVSLLEMREGIIVSRKERRRREQYEEMQAQIKRQQLAQSVQATRSR